MRIKRFDGLFHINVLDKFIGIIVSLVELPCKQESGFVNRKKGATVYKKQVYYRPRDLDQILDYNDYPAISSRDRYYVINCFPRKNFFDEGDPCELEHGMILINIKNITVPIWGMFYKRLRSLTFFLSDSLKKNKTGYFLCHSVPTDVEFTANHFNFFQIYMSGTSYRNFLEIKMRQEIDEILEEEVYDNDYIVPIKQGSIIFLSFSEKELPQIINNFSLTMGVHINQEMSADLDWGFRYEYPPIRISDD